MHKIEEMRASVAFVKEHCFTRFSPPCISNMFQQLKSIIRGGGKTEELLLEATSPINLQLNSQSLTGEVLGYIPLG